MPSTLLFLRKVLSLPQGLLLLCYSLAPRQSQAHIFDALSAAIPVPELDRRQNGALGPSLRIVAIGDSITEGTGSTDSNSYRLDLRNALVNSGKLCSTLFPTQSLTNEVAQATTSILLELCHSETTIRTTRMKATADGTSARSQTISRPMEYSSSIPTSLSFTQAPTI